MNKSCLGQYIPHRTYCPQKPKPLIICLPIFIFLKGGFLLARLIKYLIENFASEERATEVEEFFKNKQFPGTERTVSQAVETIRLNAAWLKRDRDSLAAYLKKD